MSRTWAEGFADDAETNAVTRTFVVPTMLHDLVASNTVSPDRLATLDRVIVGGSGAAPELLREFHDRFGVRPTLSYGLSEAPTGVVRESLDDPIGSGRGFPLPHLTVETRSDTGEICLRPTAVGPWAGSWTGTLGYLGEPERTAALFDGDCLLTGDLGTIDADGALSVTGRTSSLIIRGGKNIDPTEIEARLCTLDGISDALCVGVDDERLGERVACLIVPSSETSEVTGLGDAEPATALAEATGSPIDLVAIVEALPRNAMGKLDRGAGLARFTGSDTHRL